MTQSLSHSEVVRPETANPRNDRINYTDVYTHYNSYFGCIETAYNISTTHETNENSDLDGLSVLPPSSPSFDWKFPPETAVSFAIRRLTVHVRIAVDPARRIGAQNKRGEERAQKRPMKDGEKYDMHSSKDSLTCMANTN